MLWDYNDMIYILSGGEYSDFRIIGTFQGPDNFDSTELENILKNFRESDEYKNSDDITHVGKNYLLEHGFVELPHEYLNVFEWGEYGKHRN